MRGTGLIKSTIPYYKIVLQRTQLMLNWSKMELCGKVGKMKNSKLASIAPIIMNKQVNPAPTLQELALINSIDELIISAHKVI